MKKLNICLRTQDLNKIEKELIRQGKNPEKNKSDFIRRLISTYDQDNIYFTDDQFEEFSLLFQDINRLGININQLMYYLNCEHIEYVKRNDNRFILNAEDFSELAIKINNEVISLKNEMRKLAKDKRID
tara:strand:- start:851 stop:1237 length:387 start_codon:yes stop_codon:yes gene_type:complete